MRNKVKVVTSSKQPSVCASEVLTCQRTKKRPPFLQKSKRKEAFESHDTCDYRQEEAIQQFISEIHRE